ncbi:MAG TPA: matrixin family metalloprotease [Thermoanaerobaculia bacterium]|nr:matrixin family metalloprotease [Thermoanaerobaculia bacterium]
MMNRKSAIPVFIVLAALVVSSASAYVLLSPRRTWDGAMNVTVDNRGAASITDVNGGITATVAAITANIAWNGSGTGTRVTAQSGSVSSWRLGDGVVMLNFRDPQRACKGSCLAATFTGYYRQRSDGSYQIYDADIVTNTRYDWTSLTETDGCSGEFYIEGVMVHEVGHALGLGHSNVTGSTMYPSVSSCNNNPASAAADDNAAIQDLY